MLDASASLAAASPTTISDDAIASEARGWDVAQLHERRFDLAPLAGIDYRREDGAFAYLDDWRGSAAAELVTTLPLDHPYALLDEWDPQRRELRHDFYDLMDGTEIWVIGHDGFVTHFGFARSALIGALGHGPTLLDELERSTPCPTIGEASEGAGIDVRSTAIGLWRDDEISPQTYEALRARWPGWRIAREIDG